MFCGGGRGGEGGRGGVVMILMVFRDVDGGVRRYQWPWRVAWR